MTRFVASGGRRAVRRTPAPQVRSRSDWQALAQAALNCARDLEAMGSEVASAAPPDPTGSLAQRLMDLGRKARGASINTLEREAGQVTAGTAAALARVVGVMTLTGTRPEDRATLTGPVAALATALMDQFHDLNTRAFAAAHRGRPEVWG